MNDKKIKSILKDAENILNKPSSIEEANIKYENLLNKPNKTQYEKDYVETVGKIKRNKESQDNYIKKYKHLEILMYDIETFIPTYKGVPKWKGE
jgi:hypothetical protein